VKKPEIRRCDILALDWGPSHTSGSQTAQYG